MRRALLGVFVVALVVGCAKKKPTIVAKVGDIKITLGELEKRIPTREFKDEAEELKIKESALDRVIETKLFLLEAKKRGYDKEEEFQKGMESLTEDAAIKQMYTEVVVDKVTVSDEEVRKMWERLGEEARARIIQVETREEAEQILEKLRTGADFSQLAKEKSIDEKSAKKGGDLGWVKWDAFDDELSQAMFALNPGEMSDVVEVRGMYYIIKVEGKKKAERKEFEEEKERLKEEVTMRKRSRLAQDFVDKLKEKAGISFDEGVLSWIEAKVNAQPDQMRGQPPQFTPEEKNKVVVRFDNKVWTIGEVLKRYGSMPPPLTSINSIKRGIEGLIIRGLIWDEAKRRGIHKENEVQQRVKERSEIELATRMRREALQIDYRPTDDDLRKYYDTHKSEYNDKEFEEVKGRIRIRMMTDKRRQKEKETIEELKKKYPVEIYEENLLVKKESEKK